MIKSQLIEKQQLNDILKMKIDLSYPKKIDSKIINDASAINRIVGKKIKKYHLVYRAS